MPKLSIVILCYNSTKFLSATFEMLISQGLHDCEVPVVNDGSKDDASYIAYQYAKRNEEIKIIDKENEKWEKLIAKLFEGEC